MYVIPVRLACRRLGSCTYCGRVPAHKQVSGHMRMCVHTSRLDVAAHDDFLALAAPCQSHVVRDCYERVGAPRPHLAQHHWLVERTSSSRTRPKRKVFSVFDKRRKARAVERPGANLSSRVHLSLEGVYGVTPFVNHAPRPSGASRLLGQPIYKPSTIHMVPRRPMDCMLASTCHLCT